MKNPDNPDSSAKNRSPHLSIVIPAYNEEKRIGKSLERILRYLDRQKFSYEILIVDDGSTDATIEVVKEFQKEHPQISVLKNPQNRGKGYSVKRGVLGCAGTYILFSDADLSTPIEETDKLLGLVEGGYDVGIGSRALKTSQIHVRQPWYREAMGKIFNKWVRLFAVSGIYDTQCGFKIFNSSAARSIFGAQRMDGFSFDVEILWLARKFGFRIKEVPVAWRHEEYSRVHPIRDAAGMLFDLFRIRLNDCLGRYPEPHGLDSEQRSCAIRAALVVLGMSFGLWGIRWCVPSAERINRVLPPEVWSPSFQEKLASSWQGIYTMLGQEPLLSPHSWDSPFSGTVHVPAGWTTPPDILVNPARSYFLRSGQEDEAPILVALSRVKPWKLEINPKIYTYGGLYMYSLGAWIAFCAVLTLHLISPHLSHYLNHPDQLATLYVAGRIYSVVQYLAGGLLVNFLGGVFWDAETGFWAALFFLACPGIVLQAHTMKPHLLGALFVMGTFYYCAKALRRRADEGIAARTPVMPEEDKSSRQKRWVWAGIMVGAAAGSAPYLGLAAGLVPAAMLIELWTADGFSRQSIETRIRCAVFAGAAAAAVFLITNPFFIYQFGTSIAALHKIGQASSQNPSLIWQFPLQGFRSTLTTPVAILTFLALLNPRNLSIPARGFAALALIYYLLNAWILQSPVGMIGARNFPAFFLACLLAGSLISDLEKFQGRDWLKWPARGIAAAAVIYAGLTCFVIDQNLHIDAAGRSTRHEAGQWIERHIPAGSELAFFRLPQPSSGPYFQWNRYRLTFIESSILNSGPQSALPEYLVLICPSFNQITEAGPALQKFYTRLKTFPQYSLGVIQLSVGDIYGNPLIEIYARKN